jgi:multidrug efflux pump subunit AcrA (membrane-fusion protein)
MIQKILLLVTLAAVIPLAATALSQSPSRGPGDKTAPAAENDGRVAKPSPAAEKADKASELPFTFPSKSPAAPPSLPPAKGSPPSSAAKEGSSSAREASSGSTFPTSSSLATPSSGSLSSRRELVVERALVTLIDDNKVPATEPGMLTELHVEEGHSIDKDTIVARIDSRATIAKQKVALGELMAAKAQAENDAELEVAEKAVLVAKAEYDQSLELRAKNPGAMPETQLRKDKFTWEKSLAQVKQAVNEKKIAGLTAEAKQAQYDAATIELDLREIRAPFKGTVVEVIKRVGDWVTPGEPIMHIVGLDRVRVKGFVLVSAAQGVSHAELKDRPVTITVDVGGKKHSAKGVVGFASPVIEGVGTSRQFRIWAEVDNEKVVDPVTGAESWKIQPGTVATMTIDLSDGPVRPLASGRATPSGKPQASTDAASGKTDGKSDSKVQSYKPVTATARER